MGREKSGRRPWPARSGGRLGGLALLACAGLSACASPGPAGPTRGLTGGLTGRPAVRAYNRPYQVMGRWYTPAADPGYDVVGDASWYSYPAQSRTTADGEPFDARLATAAHATLPIPSYLDVTNLANGRTLRVRLNDRGPFVAGRIIDLSRRAAEALGFLAQGTARVRVRYAGPAPLRSRSEVTRAEVSPTVPPDASPQQAWVARWGGPSPSVADY